MDKMAHCSQMNVCDLIQKHYDLSAYSLLRDIFLVAAVSILYISVEGKSFVTFVKLYITLMVVRYLFSILTKFSTQSVNKARYFQISGHMTMFMTICLVAQKHGVISQSTLMILTLMYGFLNVVVRAHFATDIIHTYFLVMFIAPFFLKD